MDLFVPIMIMIITPLPFETKCGGEFGVKMDQHQKDLEIHSKQAGDNVNLSHVLKWMGQTKIHQALAFAPA